ncbi:hypothetical protein U9M48_027609 [Paspalum notatum var. saurae]|uniref:CAAX prenyl protease 2/Lysostaphin resistance protein A-like domain-containing protein n=1 Tax=Paspalum notatum var. saurae TaxID=547442 RepID=A0AAQ3X0A6_PASNO
MGIDKDKEFLPLTIGRKGVGPVPRFIKENLHGRILRFQTQRWTVPWTGQTIAQVMILWIATFWFVGSWIVPFLAHAAGFSKETLTHRGQALYSLLTDITEGLAGIAILHQCLGRFRPLPPGWFEFNLKGKWHLDVALGCLIFPLVNLLSHINISLVPMSPGPVVGVSSVEQSIVARDPVAMALYAVVVTVCAPIWEEIVFRGFLLPSLTRYMPLSWSILASAAAFALAHFNAQRVMPLVFLGVVMGGVFARSRNLLASMVLHSLWNGFVFLDLMKSKPPSPSPGMPMWMPGMPMWTARSVFAGELAVAPAQPLR